MKDIDNYTDEEGDPCFGMPNPTAKPPQKADVLISKMPKELSDKIGVALMDSENYEVAQEFSNWLTGFKSAIK